MTKSLAWRSIVTKHYNEQADQYDISILSTMPDQNIRRLEIQNLLKYLNEGDRCLEIGCGNGTATRIISETKILDMLAVDANAKMIKLAKSQNMSKVKGTLIFTKKDILNLKSKEKFDVVYTMRCIINLLDQKIQLLALTNLANSVKIDGKLILLEAFEDGWQELNQARREVGLENIPPAYHNLHLKKDKVIKHLSKIGFHLVNEDNFLSSYYFNTRVIYPALAKANSVDVVFNSKIAEFFSTQPSYGNFSHIKILCFQRDNQKD